MNSKINVTAVSYLNTKPLLYGIEHHPIREKLNLQVAYPSLIAKALAEGTTDIGLVSTASLLTLPNAEIVGSYGIGASGKVASVCIYSQVPLNKVEKIYLDYQSRTSVKLAEILLKNHWNLAIPLVDAPENYIELLEGNVAGVIIGDRALRANHDFEYVYDLAENWKLHTGLDFLFAAWIATKPILSDFLEEFDQANALGVDSIDKVIEQNTFPYYDLNTYYRKNILYKIDDNKRAGLSLFLEMVRKS